MTRGIWFTFLLTCAVACGGTTTPAATDSEPEQEVPDDTSPVENDEDETPSVEMESPRIEGQVLLTLVDSDDDEDEIEELIEEFEGAEIERIGDNYFLVDVGNDEALQEILEELDDDIRVVTSEPNYLAESPEGGPGTIKILGGDLLSAIPNQPAYAGLQLNLAHQLSTGAGIVVAVIDTGIDPTHPLFAGRIAPGGFDFLDFDQDPTEERNFQDDDGDGLVDEQFGHGTFIASQILTVAPDARILPIRVLNDDGFTSTSNLAAAITHAVNNGAHVISFSISLPRKSNAVQDAVNFAVDRGVVFVAAAGNGSTERVDFPARFGDVLAVSAIGSTNAFASFANRGNGLDLVAPGVDIIGAAPLELGEAGTARWSGTSFAAPLAAGTAALLLAFDPELSGGAVHERILESAQAIGEPFGHGLLNPWAALNFDD